MTDRVAAAVRAVLPDYRRQFERKPLLPLELAQTVVDYDGLAIQGFREEMESLRAMPDPVAFVLSIIREEGKHE